MLIENRLEVGNVYRNKRAPGLFLAVTLEILVRVKNKEILEVHPKPSNSWEVLRHVSVARICRDWQVTIERLDEIAGTYINPEESKTVGLTRPKRRQGKRGSQDEEFSENRARILHRLRYPG